MQHAPSASPARSSRLQVHLLGAFRLEREKNRRAAHTAGRQHAKPIHLPTRKTESLLAYLLLHPEAHPRNQLAALLWGDVPDDLARSSLRRALVLLRQALGADLLLADRAIIQLNPALPLWVDAREFQSQAEAFLRSDSADSAINLGLYQGDLLADFYDDWIEPLREHLRSLYLQVLLALAHRWRARAEYGRAIDFANQVLAREAANEAAHQIVMFCYATLGQYAEALQQFETCRRTLREELGVDPSPETQALVQWIKEQRAAKSARTERVTNLPVPLTSFVGRDCELAELAPLLQATRLLTLTGVGGCGKTRLAIQLAGQVADGFKDGVWWVELVGLRDQALVTQAIAQTLGVREVPHQSLLETLTNFLHQKHLLLILDNCEHLLDACAYIGETLLASCPDLRVLTTSRQSFNIAGETAWIVPSLWLPEVQFLAAQRVDKDQLATLAGSEAVRLFVERARAVKSDFELTQQNALSVAHICQWLDAIPLAIELAAARIKLLTAEHLAARLHNRFGPLTTDSRTALPRHQTLRACMDWSYDLLPDEARKVFRRLSVFVGGFTLEAAEAVCSEEDLPAHALLDQLSRLVDRSLVNVEQRGGNERYHLLETIREYALERLRESGEGEYVRNRHLGWFLKIAEQAAPELRGAGQAQWLARLETEHGNLRAALQWGIMERGDAALGLHLAVALADFWELRWYLKEGRIWLEAALRRAGGEMAVWRAEALQAAGGLAFYDADMAASRSLLEQGLVIFRILGDRPNIGKALWKLSYPLILQGALQEARKTLEESLEINQSLENKLGVACSLQGLGLVAEGQAHWPAARALFEASLAIFRELGDKHGAAGVLQDLGIAIARLGDSLLARSLLEESFTLGQELGSKFDIGRTAWALGQVALLDGDYASARPWYDRAITSIKELGNIWGMPYLLDSFGVLAAGEGKLERAARLLAAAVGLGDAMGVPLAPFQRADHERSAAVVRAGLGEQVFKAAWAEGEAMTLEQAIEYALQT